MAGWFSASMRIVCLVEGTGSTLQDECVHVFTSTDWDAAFARAVELGRTHEGEYENGDGKLVRWRLDRVLALNALGEDPDGLEVHSAMDVFHGADFDAAFDPLANPPERPAP